MYPTKNDVIVPALGDKPRPITIEEVRQYGRIMAISHDEKSATMEVTIPGSLIVTYCGVTLNEDHTVKDFFRRPTNEKEVFNDLV